MVEPSKPSTGGELIEASDRSPVPLGSEVDWEVLQRVWQKPPPAEGLPDLAKLIRRRSWAIWALTGADVLMTLFYVAWGAWRVHVDPSPELYVLLAIVAMALAMGWWCVLRIRRGTWRADTSAPLAMVDFSIRRVRASVRLAKWNMAMLPIALTLGFLLRISGYRPPSLGFESGPTLRVSMLVFVAIWFAASWWYWKLKNAEWESLRILREELARP